MVLHTINKTDELLLKQCLRYSSAGDVLVLIDEGVYLAREEYASLFEKCGMTLCLLEGDLMLRGLNDAVVEALFRHIDYGDFIDLTAQNDKLINWM